jgi:hypothetical protein
MDTFLQNRLDEMAKSIKDEKGLIAAYSSLRAFEGDFDKAQASLRTIASAWLLTTVGGLGLLFQSEFSSSNAIPPGLASSLRQTLILLSSMGLSSLWYLDQAVYQKLLHSAFGLGCWLESKFRNLPPIRSYMFRTSGDITERLGWFYLAPIIALFITGAINFVIVFLRYPPNRWYLSALILIVHLGCLLWLMRHRKTWSTLPAELPQELTMP